MPDGPETPPTTDLHSLTIRRTINGYLAVCGCGEWEGWFSGPSGKEMVVDDHDHHRRAAANGANTPPLQ